MLTSPGILRLLVEAGSIVAEVDDHGWNCLFQCVSGSRKPSSSRDFEALQYLLTVFDEIFARDNFGMNIFGEVRHYRHRHEGRKGSYREDLWYCALYRSRLPLTLNIPAPPMPPLFTSEYQSQHYRALLYLDTWDFQDRVWCERTLPLLNSYTFSQVERQTCPAFGQWNPSDLLMMEERMSRAFHLNDDSDSDSEDDDGNASEEDGDEENGDEDDGNELSSARGPPNDSSDEWETESEEDEAH